MNQLPPVPVLGLTLTIPKERVQGMLEAQIAKGSDLIREKAPNAEAMAQLKKRSWDWTVETCNFLRQCFGSETVAQYFASNVFFQPSLKLDDFERELDEFPPVIRGKLERLFAFSKTLMVIPEPPCGDYIAAQSHPRIYHKAWRPFELGQLGVAINAAVKEIEDSIKEATAGAFPETGAALVKKAFDPESGPLFDKEGTISDNQAVADMLHGFFLRYQSMSPNAVLGIESTARAISLASYLMYIMDDKIPKRQEQESPAYEFEFLKD